MAYAVVKSAVLTPYDLELHSRIVRIAQGKGRKDRNVPVGKVATQFLREYVKRVRPVFDANEAQAGTVAYF